MKCIKSVGLNVRHILVALIGMVVVNTIMACSHDKNVYEASSLTDATTHKIDELVAQFVAQDEVFNPEALIPPQCYTKTEGKNNPCYVCHQSNSLDGRPNYMSDGALQGIYAFSDAGETNSWSNLFVNRSERIDAIDDDWMVRYVNQDNYKKLIQSLEKNENYTGPIPKIKNLASGREAFDELGLAKDGSGWVSYNYKPFPSTFWPTNGSFGDGMIRLPKAFRQIGEKEDRSAYIANLSILEMTIKNLDGIKIPALSEIKMKTDLNGDQYLSDEVTYIAARRHFVGDAKAIAAVNGLYPEGTEFIHTVRYLGVSNNGDIYMPRRMKELRYMKKEKFKSAAALKNVYYRESKEKYHGNLARVTPLGDKGISNGMGWSMAAFIEDQKGDLRPQHHEELMFCVGCHKNIGTTYDQTFSFARKMEGASGWGYIDLTNQIDTPNIGEDVGEYLQYMNRVGGGDEFRQNTEMLEKWFLDNGELNIGKVANTKSLYDLIMPSPERAKDLNKAYYTIVQDQNFIFGRDANLMPAKNVYLKVNTDIEPLSTEHRYMWDMQLDWSNQFSNIESKERIAESN